MRQLQLILCLLESDNLSLVKIGDMFVCSGVFTLSSALVCKPCGGYKCLSHVFVCLCKDCHCVCSGCGCE